MINKSVAISLLRYGIVGLSANGGMYLGYLLATHLGLAPTMAMTILYACGTLATFFFNRAWTFQATPDRHMLARYLGAYAIGYALNWGLLTLMTERLEVSHQMAQAFCIVVVAIALFVLMRTWVFPNQVTAHSNPTEKP